MSEYQNTYPCFDDTTTCHTTRQINGSINGVAKSLVTCYYPTDGSGIPRSFENITLNTDLNRLVIETIGHIDPITPVTFYLDFQTQNGNSTVEKVFIFSTH